MRYDSARLIAAAIIALGAAAGFIASWPGHLSYDSVVQLAEGRTGVYSGDHPPVMSWLLGVADAFRPGAALFVVFDTVLIVGALVSLVALGRRVAWPTSLVALAFVAFPQLLIYPSIVWKDVLFAASATAGFACLAHAAAGWSSVKRRAGLLAATLLLLSLATLARQNGAVVLPFAAVAVGGIAAKRSGAGLAPGLVHALTFLGAAALITVGATVAFTARGEGNPFQSGAWESLQTYDIVNALSLAPKTQLPVLHGQAPWLETLLRTDGVVAYSPIRADTLGPVLEKAGERGDTSHVIAAQWKDLIFRHPLLYLRARARTFDWVFLTPDGKDCVLIYTGVDGPTEEMADLGLVYRRTLRDDTLADYALAFSKTPVLSHGAYGALGLVLLIAMLRRRQAPDLAMAAMLAGALAFALSFAVISIACDYRYLYDLDLAVIAATLYTAATWNGIVGTRSSP